MRHLLDDQSPDQENREEHGGCSQLVVILPCLVMMTERGAGWHITSRSLMLGIFHLMFVPDKTIVKSNLDMPLISTLMDECMHEIHNILWNAPISQY